MWINEFFLPLGIHSWQGSIYQVFSDGVWKTTQLGTKKIYIPDLHTPENEASKIEVMGLARTIAGKN